MAGEQKSKGVGRTNNKVEENREPKHACLWNTLRILCHLETYCLIYSRNVSGEFIC